ncbi:MAG TPA: zinc-dependent metalloprotease, partial [Gemmatimonadales bacterium]|nr:zinc-dependent metalloprotease [Gemmatimonadales bacterium]
MLRLILATLVLVTPLSAQQPPAPQAQPAAQGSPRTLSFADLTRGATAHTGFLDSYVKGDKLYLVVPASRMGNPFLMESKLAQGIGANGLFGGTMLNLFEANVVTLERKGDQIFLIQQPHRFTADQDAAARKAVELTFSPSVLESAKIESWREDSAAVIDVANWFVSDLSGISQRVRFAAAQGPGVPPPVVFDRQRSYLESVKAFPRNVNVRARVTFRPQNPVGLSSVPDGRYISIAIFYTLAELPTQPMKVRLGDDRVGNFLTAHKDFSQEDSTPYVRLVNRWRLEPAERVGDKYRPVTPITYYIDPNVPEPYRAPMKAGVEAWNAAFEAAGWIGAIRALDLPADADPEDIRYATLRWNVSDQPGYGAIGPSTVDPRTAEILDADILFEGSMFAGFRATWRDAIRTLSASEAFQQALGVGAYEFPDNGSEIAGFGTSFAAQGSLLHAALVARGEIAAGDPVPADYINAAVKWVTMHEVGHSLGLQHNFRSSASTPFAKLHDKAWAEQNGLYSSVMEYPTPNIAPRGKPNGYYYTPGIGSYDRWAISYAYVDDAAAAARLARDVADPRHLYGSNPESGGPGALDPSINVFDLSDDPLAWAKERTALVHGLFATLPKEILTDNRPYYELSAAYQSLAGMYAQAMAPVVKYLGGQYINRDHAGDPNGRPPFENIPIAKQREALAFILDGVFAEDALALPPAVLQKLGSNRWFHWGSTTTWNGRVDFPYHEQVLAFQAAMLDELFQPFRLARIRDGETKFGEAQVVTIPELMNGVTKAVWAESWGPTLRNTTAIRRDLQRAYLDDLTHIVVRPAPRTPADARSVARMQLRDLDRKLARVSAATALDAYTRAHIEESRARIQKALTAGLEAER